jgi:hypothetical protein
MITCDICNTHPADRIGVIIEAAGVGDIPHNNEIQGTELKTFYIDLCVDCKERIQELEDKSFIQLMKNYFPK